MESIYLVGFMGSGKSTVGKALAKRLNLQFIDTDDQIEEKSKKNIPDIFADEGEIGFRKIEQNVLLETPNHHHIIATGGGIIEQDANREWLLDKKVIYLKTSWHTIKNRLKNDQSRPIWQDQSRDKQQLLEKRNQLYQEVSTLTIDTDNHTVDSIIEQIEDQFE